MADTIVLVGGETLMGREVRELFAESSLGGNLRLVAAEEEESGKITEIGGAAAFLSKLDPDAVEDAGVLVLAGTPKSSRDAMEANRSALVVDLTFETEDDPDARLRAPIVEGPGYQADRSGPQVVAHPAATAIAMVLRRLHRTYPIAACVVNAFEPASALGKAGIDELQSQTVSLLSFQPMPKKVFDAQVSFAMLAQFGDEAAAKLHEIEERIERHLATLLGSNQADLSDGVPMPSLRLIQSSVFHGYSFSLWIEFEDTPSAEEVEEALSGEFIDVRGGGMEAPNNVSVAGQGGVAVGAIAPDRNNANAIWMWMAADNLRLAAENAVLIVREAL